MSKESQLKLMNENNMPASAQLLHLLSLPAPATVGGVLEH